MRKHKHGSQLLWGSAIWDSGCWEALTSKFEKPHSSCLMPTEPNSNLIKPTSNLTKPNSNLTKPKSANSDEAKTTKTVTLHN